MGPAAAGHVEGRRWRNVPRLSQYNAHDGLPLVEDIELLSESSQAGETLMLGLRLREGIPKERVQMLLSVKNGDWRVQVIEHYMQEGLLALSPNLQLTTQGILLADTIIGDLLMEPTPMVDTSKQENNG